MSVTHSARISNSEIEAPPMARLVKHFVAKFVAKLVKSFGRQCVAAESLDDFRYAFASGNGNAGEVPAEPR